MTTQIFVNLPVADLEKSKAFYTALGHRLNPKFSDDKAACVVVSETIFVMLLARDYFQSFTARPVAQAQGPLQTLLALSVANRPAVDAALALALAAGGREAGQARDYGFMYQRSFEDPDGHTWEIFHMNEAEFPGA